MEKANMANNESDYPPLPSRQRPQALALRPATRQMRCKPQSQSSQEKSAAGKTDVLSMMDAKHSRFDPSAASSPSSPRGTRTAIKRPKEKDLSDGEFCPSFQRSDTLELADVNLSSPSGVKRSKRLMYRDPPTLPSWDPFDSLPSDQSQHGLDSPYIPFLSSISPGSSYTNNNLGSLTEIIEQYNDTKINSLSDVESPIISSPVTPPKVNKPEVLGLPTDIPSSRLLSPGEKVTANLHRTIKSSVKSEKDEAFTTHASKDVVQATKPQSNSKPTASDPGTTANCSDNQVKSVISPIGKKSFRPTIKIEAASDKLLIKNKICKKNKGHKGFLLPSELKVKNLPPEIQSEDSITFFNSLSQLVVRITVQVTSADRGPNDMYASYIGSHLRRNGSGFIASVDDHLTKMRCKKADCCGSDDLNLSGVGTSSPFTDSGTFFSPPPGVDRNLSVSSSSSAQKSGNTSNHSRDSGILLSPSTAVFDRNLSVSSSTSHHSSGSTSSRSSLGGDTPTKHYIYGGVYINTNKHVIFDKSEAESAHVQFFYNTPDKQGVIHGHVNSITGVNNKQDRVTLLVMSHDQRLFDILRTHLKNTNSSYKQMVQSTHLSQQVHGMKHEHSWAVVISHAHGLAKSVTVGRVQKEVKEAFRVVKYYDTPTCPGSSGGLVITPSLLKLQWPGAVHSCCDKATGLNVTFDSRFPDLNAKEVSRLQKPMLTRKNSSSESIYQL